MVTPGQPISWLLGGGGGVCASGPDTGAMGKAHRGRLFFFLLAVGRLLASTQFPGRGGDSEEGLGATC